MARVPAELREHILAFWRGHSEAWKLSGLTQTRHQKQLRLPTVFRKVLNGSLARRRVVSR